MKFRHAIRLWPALGDTSPTIVSLAIAPDGKHVAAVYEGHGLYVFSVADGANTFVLAAGRRVAFRSKAELAVATRSGIELRSVDGEKRGEVPLPGAIDAIAAADDDGAIAIHAGRQVHVWRRGAIEAAWPAHDGAPQSIAVSPDGSTIVTRCAGDVVVWSATGDRVATLSGDGGSGGLALAPTILALSRGNTIALADRDGAVARRIETLGHVWSLAFDRSGAYVASGDVDGRIAIWNASTGGCVATPRETGDAVSAIAWSSKSLVAACGVTIEGWAVR
jgi:WD40 repeat protein